MSAVENWRAIPGCEGHYEVSDLGRVRNARTGRVRRLSMDRRGRWRFTAFLRGERRTFPVHRAVTRAFLGPAPAGQEIDHRNGVKTDNRLTNLEYVTPAENRRRAQSLGLCKRPGEKNGRAVLDAEKAVEIRRLAGVVSVRLLAEQFGVAPRTVRGVIHRETWRDQ